MKRVILFVLAALILVSIALVGYQLLYDPGSDQVGAPVKSSADQIARGAYLARVGDCVACHTMRGGKPFSGGRAIATPYGKIYSPNITPDAETGIGAWNADDFWRALHNGKSRNGEFLYPAFPFTDYTKVTRTDSDALFAYFKSLEAVHQSNRQQELRFPYNQRPLLAAWRSLYFRPGSYSEEKNQSTEWNRGAYLVQGLGHCNACHTGRAAFGSSDTNSDMAGGMIPILNWYAPSLTSSTEAGLGNWDQHAIADLLKKGISGKSAVFGPMAEVVANSAQYLTDEDANAMAAYLKSLPQNDAQPDGEDRLSFHDVTAVMIPGAQIYAKRCAACHQSKGQGIASIYPPLAGNRALTMQSAANPIRMVLNGGYPPSTEGNPRPYGMPPFGHELNAEEVASVVTYIRNAWGNHAEAVSPTDVSRFIGTPLE